MFRLANTPTPRLVLLAVIPTFLILSFLTCVRFGDVARSNKPFFSLWTNRTFGTNESPLVWLEYRGLSSVDFRIYHINDPTQFFTQLNDPHQLGKEELAAAAGPGEPTLLERFGTIKLPFRAAAKRVPLQREDFARVPLLNPNQLETSWRELLPEYSDDRHMVPLGPRHSGVYLVEAVSDELCAYTAVVVTDLALVETASTSGELLISAVDRQSGAPRSDVRVEVIRSKASVASGRTNAEGIYRTKISLNGMVSDPDGPEMNNSHVAILASDRDQFAIAELDAGSVGNHGRSYVSQAREKCWLDSER